MDLTPPISPATTNARLAFTFGGLDAMTEFNQSLLVYNPSATGLSNLTLVAPFNATLPTNPNPNRVALIALIASKGLFNGSFTMPGATTKLNRRAPFYGQIVNTISGLKGYGFFLLPTVPVYPKTVATSPKLSGQLLFTAP